MADPFDVVGKAPGLLPLLSADEIDIAAKRISEIIEPTPLQRIERLSVRSGADVYVKREDLTAVRSCKVRGAYNLIVQLTASERAAGVVAASAGNHGQGVAFVCRVMGIRGRVYVPATTPRQKQDRIRAHGGDFVRLIAVGDTFDAAVAAAAADVACTGATLVASFEDPRAVAGQGTIAAEILDQFDHVPDVVIVPVGGGGCLAGIGTYLRERSPETALLGVEPAGAASMTAALLAGGPVSLPEVDSFVDEAAVCRVGELPFATVSEFGGRVVSRSVLPLPVAEFGFGTGAFRVMPVDEGAVCTAMLELYQNEGIVAEPAGALAIAALAGIEVERGSTVVCLVSGGNNDVSRYGEVVERSLVHLGLKHYFLVDFPQEPGVLRRFLDEVQGPDDITVFEYVKRNNRDTGAALVGIELGAPDGLEPLLERMVESPVRCERLDPGSPVYHYFT